jgi:hypothetical protein
MQKLVDIVMQKTGLNQEQAQAAVEAVLGYVKTKLPPSLAGEFDALIAGDASGIEGEVENLAKGFLGNLFGGSK